AGIREQAAELARQPATREPRTLRDRGQQRLLDRDELGVSGQRLLAVGSARALRDRDRVPRDLRAPHGCTTLGATSMYGSPSRCQLTVPSRRSSRFSGRAPARALSSSASYSSTTSCAAAS